MICGRWKERNGCLSSSVPVLSHTMSTSFRIRTDGGSRGNPGPSGIGVVIEDAETGSIVETHKRFLGVTTNNQAEYKAVILGLERCHALGAKKVEVLADSELLIRQAKGEYKVKNIDLQARFREMRALVMAIGQVTFKHVYREQNKAADALANEAMDEARGMSGF